MFAAQNRRPQISCNVGPEISTYHESVSRTSTDLAQLYGALCARKPGLVHSQRPQFKVFNHQDFD